MDVSSPKSSDVASSMKDILTGFRRSSKYFFHHLTIFSATVSSSPPRPNTTWDGSPNYLLEHSWGQLKVLLHSLAKFLQRLSFTFNNHQSCSQVSHLVPAGCFSYPPRNQASKDSFFNLTASLISGVHQQVLGLPLRREPTSFRPQLLKATSTMTVLNMVHSDSMSLSSLGRLKQFSWRFELKISRTGTSTRHSQFILTIHLGLPGLFVSLLHQRIQLTTRWWLVDNSTQLFSQVSKTYDLRSNETTTKLIINLWPEVVWYQVQLWTTLCWNMFVMSIYLYCQQSFQHVSEKGIVLIAKDHELMGRINLFLFCVSSSKHSAESFRPSAQNETSITLQWNKVNNNVSFVLQFNGAETNISAPDGDGAVTHTVSSLTAGTKYAFTLFSVFENVRSSGVNITTITGKVLFP